VAIAVIPGAYELDFKALARLTGDRRMEMLPLKDVQNVTGYIRGGVTALGMKKNYPVFADETMELWESICVSAGQRGLQIVIAPGDYLRATSATVGEISREKP
jgi:Cys-tRNA(Pro)/Cys-tRNA(Cys) deacylase